MKKQLLDTITLNIAGFNIGINLNKTDHFFLKNKIKSEICKYYNGFIIKEAKNIDYSIDFIGSRNLEILIRTKEKKHFINFYERKDTKSITTNYEISILQFQIIIRDILVLLLAKNGFLIHGSATEINKRAHLFLGLSGAGKSTTITLLRNDFNALADDSLIIKREKDDFFMYQTPFIEKNTWIKRNNRRYRVEKIFFLKKAKFFRTNTISNKEIIIEKMFAQFFTEEKCKKNQIKCLLKFISKFDNFYYLHFAKDSKKMTKFFDNL